MALLTQNGNRCQALPLSALSAGGWALRRVRPGAGMDEVESGSLVRGPGNPTTSAGPLLFPPIWAITQRSPLGPLFQGKAAWSVSPLMGVSLPPSLSSLLGDSSAPGGLQAPLASVLGTADGGGTRWSLSSAAWPLSLNPGGLCCQLVCSQGVGGGLAVQLWPLESCPRRGLAS